MATDDEVTALAERVAAEPTPEGRADVLGVDLPRMSAARRRFQVIGWSTAALIAVVVVSAPISRFLLLADPFRDFFIHRLLTHALWGVALAFLAFPLARTVSRLVGAALRGGGPGRVFVRSVLAIAATPASLLVAGLVTASDPFAQIGIIVGTPLAAAVVSTRIADISRRVHENDPSVATETVLARRLPGIQTLYGYRVRWMLLHAAINLVHWTATALLVIVVPWSLPAVVAGRVFLVVVENGAQSNGCYRWSIAANAVYTAAVTAIALLLGGSLLFPWPLVQYGVSPA